ncbi:MAG: hypothetical protein R2874_14535 [Desulfobacterales bacterium]
MISIPNYEIGKTGRPRRVAEVYLARHKLLDRTVAIKLISPTNADDLADKRFLKEAKVVAGLRHPNIVSIYDVGVYETNITSSWNTWRAATSNRTSKGPCPSPRF